MIPTTYKDLSHPHLHATLVKLVRSPIVDVKRAYHVAKLVQALEGELSLFNDLKGQIQRTYFATDEKGRLLHPLEGRETELHEKTTDLLAITIEVPGEKLLLSDLSEACLLPIEILSLDPFLEKP